MQVIGMIKLMLVDDNHIAMEYYSTLVPWKELGFELVCTANDGEAALIRFRQFRPDVVITDVQMPNMNGIELTQAIREIAKLVGGTDVSPAALENARDLKGNANFFKRKLK